MYTKKIKTSSIRLVIRKFSLPASWSKCKKHLYDFYRIENNIILNRRADLSSSINNELFTQWQSMKKEVYTEQ